MSKACLMKTHLFKKACLNEVTLFRQGAVKLYGKEGLGDCSPCAYKSGYYFKNYQDCLSFLRIIRRNPNSEKKSHKR